MFNSLSLDEWLGRSRNPPRSVLRPILVLINCTQLRPFLTRHLQCDELEFATRQRAPTFFNIDEECFFTFAEYIEPFSSVATTVNNLRRVLVHRILRTWSIRIRSTMLNLHIVDWQGEAHTLNGEDNLYQILGAYHPFWFRGCSPDEHIPHVVAPFNAYLVRLQCTGNEPACP